MRSFVAILMLMCAGCFTTGAKDVPASPPPVPNLPPPVSAEQITPQNARFYLQALTDEMNREEQMLWTVASPK